MNARMEMNMKANHITDPEHLRMNNYMRMTIGQFQLEMKRGRRGDDVSMDLSGTPVTGNTYYEDGMYYMDMMDQKIKQPMPLEQMMKECSSRSRAWKMADWIIYAESEASHRGRRTDFKLYHGSLER